MGTNNTTSSIEVLGIWSYRNAQIDLRDLCTFNFHLTVVVNSLIRRQQRKTRFLRMSLQLITFLRNTMKESIRPHLFQWLKI